MATVSAHLDVPVEAVASVLTDPRAYDGIVVGSRRIRWFDARWPDEGTNIHHTVGFGPVTVRDRTEVLRNDLPSALELATKVRPLGTLRVTFRLHAEGDGTHVEVQEEPLSGPVARVWNPALDVLTARRNDVMLRRLGKLAAAREHVRRLDGRPGNGGEPAGSST